MNDNMQGVYIGEERTRLVKRTDSSHRMFKSGDNLKQRLNL